MSFPITPRMLFALDKHRMIQPELLPKFERMLAQDLLGSLWYAHHTGRMSDKETSGWMVNKCSRLPASALSSDLRAVMVQEHFDAVQQWRREHGWLG